MIEITSRPEGRTALISMDVTDDEINAVNRMLASASLALVKAIPCQNCRDGVRRWSDAENDYSARCHACEGTGTALARVRDKAAEKCDFYGNPVEAAH